jgi:hypothetical protein
MFYTGDWKKDPDLSKCSAATRGIWIDLLCAMHENGRTGIITGTVHELAQMCRCSAPEMHVALAELKRNKTAHVQKCPRLSNGYQVTNRRMNREHKDREYWRLQKRRQRGGSVSPECPAASSVSSSSSSSRERLVSRDLSREREGSGGKQKDSLSDSDFEEFQEAYSHIDDVRRVYEKQTLYLGRPPTRQEFLGWLNREIPNRKESVDDDDRGTSAQAARVAAMLERDN